MEVLGKVLAEKGQHPCGGLGEYIGGQGPASLGGSWGMHGQPRASIVGVLGNALAAKGQYRGGLGECVGSQGTASWVSWGTHWQPRAGIPVGVLGTVLAAKGQHPCGGLEECTGNQSRASDPSGGQGANTQKVFEIAKLM